MQVSRPLSVLILLAAMVAGAVWYAAPHHKAAQIAVMLSQTTYQLLSQKAEAAVNTTGRPHTVAQVIEAFARK